jgi:hypothetical protein
MFRGRSIADDSTRRWLTFRRPMRWLLRLGDRFWPRQLPNAIVENHKRVLNGYRESAPNEIAMSSEKGRNSPEDIEIIRASGGSGGEFLR